jgi:hypothetical protein
MTDTPVVQDVVDMLTTDHHEVLDLLQQIKITSGTEERRDLADTVISELVRHSVAEEIRLPGNEGVSAGRRRGG